MGEGSRICGGANEQSVSHVGRIAGDGLAQGAIEDRAGLFTERAGLCVSHDTDDLIDDACAIDLCADGIASAKNLVNEGLIDDGNAGAGHGFGAKVCASDAGNAECVEVTRSGHEEVGGDGGIGGIGRVGKAEPVGTIATGERRSVSDNSRDDTGESCDAVTQLHHEVDCALGRVTVHAGIDGHHEHVVRVETDVDGGSALEAAQKEAGDAEENNGHGNLRDDEEIAQREAAARASEGVFAFERVGEQGSRCGPGRGDTEQKTADEAEGERVEQYTPINADGDVKRHGRREAEAG